MAAVPNSHDFKRAINKSESSAINLARKQFEKIKQKAVVDPILNNNRSLSKNSLTSKELNKHISPNII